MSVDQRPIADLSNLGPKSSQWLADAGVKTIGDLRALGAPMAYQITKKRFPQASLNLLWALAAGIENRDWREMTQLEKDALRQQLED